MARETVRNAPRRRRSGVAQTKPMCVFSLPGRARAGVVGMIDYLSDCQHYYASAFDDAVESTLDTGGYVTEEQSEGGSELILSICEQFAGPPRSRIRLTPDEARLLAELLDNVLDYQRDYDWRIVAAAEATCGLTDAPTERECSTGLWAIERARVRLTVQPRAALREGDVVDIPKRATSLTRPSPAKVGTRSRRSRTPASTCAARMSGSMPVATRSARSTFFVLSMSECNAPTTRPRFVSSIVSSSTAMIVPMPWCVSCWTTCEPPPEMPMTTTLASANSASPFGPITGVRRARR